MTSPQVNRIFIVVIAGIVCTAFFKILGWVLNQLESTAMFPLITSDWSQGHNKKNVPVF